MEEKKENRDKHVRGLRTNLKGGVSTEVLRKTGKSAVAALGLILWFIGSFSLSAQPAVDSSRLSGAIAKPLMVALQRSGLSANVAVHDVEWLLRKGAHWTLYFIFGCLLFFFVRTIWGMQVSVKMWGVFILAGIGMASLDEFHQLFVAGRSAQWQDVVLDSIGFAMGLGCCIWLHENEEGRSE